MLFNSYAFIFGFLPVTLIGFFSLTKLRLIKAAKIWLAIASLYFYGYSHFSYLPLLLISISFNYYIGREISLTKATKEQAKTLLWVGICLNICILAYYKYSYFIINSLSQLFHIQLVGQEVALPLGISFYTFTQISYLVDTYCSKPKEAIKYNFLSYNLFICFFPYLISGPILRQDELIWQFHQMRKKLFSSKNMAMGLTLFTLGLSKKVLIADNLSSWVAPIFENASTVSFIEAWVGALSYTLQLYFDFSGYSDMAIGLGWMLNINLPVNFNSPYKATSIIEFWRRWHITLSNFLRDYLYIPLGGNRRGKIRRYINLLITMLIGGLWHGAGWTFIIWGGIHGIFLVINHIWDSLKISLPKIIAWGVTFTALVFSWVLFRAQRIDDASQLWLTMSGQKNFILPVAYQSILGWLTPLGVRFQPWEKLLYLPEIGGQKSLILLAVMLLCVTFLPNSQQLMQNFKPTWWWALVVGIAATFCLISLNRVSEFLYFQF